MIAKLIAHGESRSAAIADLAAACAEVEVYPVKTNASFLVHCLDSQEFIDGQIDTGLIGRELEALTAPVAPSRTTIDAAGWTMKEHADRRAVRQGVDVDSPWIGLWGFRLNAPRAGSVRVFVGTEAFDADTASEPMRRVRLV